MIRKFFTEHKVTAVIIAVLIPVTIGVSIGLTTRMHQKRVAKENAVYPELTRYNGMEVRSKTSNGKKDNGEYFLIVCDTGLKENVCVTVSKAAYEKYGLGDCINEVKEPEQQEQFLFTEDTEEVIKRGNHEYLVLYSVITDQRGNHYRFRTAVCRYEDCAYCAE